MPDEPNDRQTEVSSEDVNGLLEAGRETLPDLVNGQPVTSAPERAPAEEAPRAETDTERLSKALQTIEGLQREVADLKGRPAPQPQVVYREPAGGEPELIEVLPGRRIPKDTARRPIRLEAEDLIRMGWNENPAQALNALANAFFYHIAEVVPNITMAHLDDLSRSGRASQSRQEGFYGEFPDLKEFGDLADIVEKQAMQELPIQNMSQGEWNRAVGTRVRQRIAAMRGISLDQYNASIAARPGGTGRPRAVTAPAGRAPARRGPTDDQQREMDAMMDGRFGG